MMDPHLPRGIEYDQCQVWRDPSDGTVILQVLGADAPQIRISAKRWEQIVAFVALPEDPESSLV